MPAQCYDRPMPCDPLHDLRAWQERLERLAAQQGTPWAPPMDVYETAERYVIAAEMPGVARDQIELALHDNRLTIRGIRAGTPETEARHYHQIERGQGSFQRIFALGEPVDAAAITADLRDGVLTVTLPKAVSPPRWIEVS
jgi:HSP20 family protein